MNAPQAVFDAALDRIFSHQQRADQGAYEARCEAAERAANAEADLREAFLALVRRGDLNAVASFEPPRSEWSKRREDGTYPTRPSTLFDVVLEMSSYRDFDRRLMDLFVRAANGAHVAADAQELMGEIAGLYASMNAETD